MLINLPRKKIIVNLENENFKNEFPFGQTGEIIESQGKEANTQTPKPEVNKSHSLKEALLGSEPLAMTFGEFRLLNLPKREYLLNGDFPLEKASITLISSDAGVGKTMLSLEIAKMVSTGGRGLGGTCQGQEPNKVLYIDGEMGFADLKDRAEYFGLNGISNLILLSKPYLEMKDVQPSLDLAEQGVRDILTDYILSHGFKLIIIDNIFSLFQMRLDSADDWALVNNWLIRLRSKNIATKLIHHNNKSKDQTGTISRLFNINTALSLKKEKPTNDNKDCCCFSIKVEKQRGQGINVAGKKYTFKNGLWIVEGGGKAHKIISNKVTVLMGLVAGRSQEAIAKEIGSTQPWISKVKQELIKEGSITKDGKITEQGQKLLDESGG